MGQPRTDAEKSANFAATGHCAPARLAPRAEKLAAADVLVAPGERPSGGSAPAACAATGNCGLALGAHTCCNPHMSMSIPPSAGQTHLRPRTGGVARFSRLTLSMLVAATCATASAQQQSAPVEAVVRAFLERETTGLPGQVSLAIGSLDARNRLPECQQLEAFLPAGARAWGQVSVGVRCLAPVAWTVYVPSRVEVIGEFLVTARPLRPGQILGPADVERRSGDLAQLGSRTIMEIEQALGQHVRFAVAAGQPLRSDMLRIPPAVQQGQTVRIVGVGTGFTIANEGKAMNRAGEGEAVKVRLGNGQVVNGIARQGGVVEVRF